VETDLTRELRWVSQIGAQLYTLRDFGKNTGRYCQDLNRVKKLGYDTVQVSGLGPIEPAELAKILRTRASFVPRPTSNIDRMENETAKVIDEHHLWGCKYTAVGGFWAPNNDWSTTAWLNFAARYNAIAKKFAGSGVSIGYHNHSHELARFDGKTALAILMEQSRQEYLDGDRHFTDHGRRRRSGPVDQPMQRPNPLWSISRTWPSSPTACSSWPKVGEGNLNWSAIIAACRSAGVEWYLVEQDVCLSRSVREPEDQPGEHRGMGIT